MASQASFSILLDVCSPGFARAILVGYFRESVMEIA